MVVVTVVVMEVVVGMKTEWLVVVSVASEECDDCVGGGCRDDVVAGGGYSL